MTHSLSYGILPVLSRSYAIASGRFVRLTDLPDYESVGITTRWPCAIETTLWESIAKESSAMDRVDALHGILFSMQMSTAKYRDFPLVVETPVSLPGVENIRVDVGYDGDGSVLCLLSAG